MMEVFLVDRMEYPKHLLAPTCNIILNTAMGQVIFQVSLPSSRGHVVLALPIGASHIVWWILKLQQSKPK
jgi:hypothetical protein